MQKRTDLTTRSDLGIPLLVSIVLGLLFFGAYLIVERAAAQALPARYIALLFIAAYAVLEIILYAVFRIRQHKRHSDQVLHEALNVKMHNVFKYLVDLPYAIVDEQGRVRVINEALQTLLEAADPFYRGNVSELCGGVTLQEINAAKGDHTPSALAREAGNPDEPQDASDEAQAGFRVDERRRFAGDRPSAASGEIARDVSNDDLRVTRDGVVVRLSDCGRFVARSYELGLGGKVNYLVTFTDISELLDLREKTAREMPALAYIDVDNLEELTQYTHASYREVSRRVDDVLIRFAAEVNGFLREYERDHYILLFSQEKLRRCEEEKFSSLLDGVRDIRLGEYNIPVTVSVGVSLSEATMSERAAEAESALDMALQRGGDQVAVRRRDGIRYYGGQTRPFRRQTKVQSRVVANFLLSKISEADNLLIMGHRNPDYDCIGASIGVAQLGLFAGVPTKIISNLSDVNFRIVTNRLINNPTYADLFVSAHKGLDLIRPGTLLIITDANNFDIIEAPDVAASVRQVSGKIVIIDHHLQAGEYDFEPVMNYIDTSASSTCELVAEMLEQNENGTGNGNVQLFNDEVASIMLSGIMLDTAGFTRNTGTRTLDAARYLYGKGANAEQTNTFFRQSYDDYVRERSFSNCKLLRGNTVGLTWSEGTGQGTDDRVAAAKEADRLLAVRGVHASFALIKVGEAIHISGRSDGSINVQLILERLGGGGRFDSAGAALTDTTVTRAVEDLEHAIEAHFTDLENSKRGEG